MEVKKPVYVYRLQDRDGLGPYYGGLYRFIPDDKVNDALENLYHGESISDVIFAYLFDDAARIRVKGHTLQFRKPLIDDFPKLKSLKKYQSGFKDLTQLVKWFRSIDELRFLHYMGFDIYKVRAKERHCTKFQCAFIADGQAKKISKFDKNGFLEFIGDKKEHEQLSKAIRKYSMNTATAIDFILNKNYEFYDL